MDYLEARDGAGDAAEATSADTTAPGDVAPDSILKPGGTGRVDVVVLDVGSATPRAAAVVAELFGLPVEAMVAAIYRAPARLLAGLEPVVAERLVKCLAALGLSLDTVEANHPIASTPTLDLAAEVADPALIDPAVETIAAFLGVPAADALELLATPPGVLLGNVSRATVAALERRLPPGALQLTTVDPATSRYALFAGALGPADRSAVEAALGPVAVAADNGLVALDLSHSEANRLWRRLARVPGVRLVNQAFLRFELVLTAIARDDAATAAALETLAGIPADAVEAVAALLPVVVEERVPHEAVEARLLAYAERGLAVTARLATFAEQVLIVDAAPAAARTLLGLDATAALPLRLPPLSPVRARLLRHRLEAAGAEIRQCPTAQDAA